MSTMHSEHEGSLACKASAKVLETETDTIVEVELTSCTNWNAPERVVSLLSLKMRRIAFCHREVAMTVGKSSNMAWVKRKVFCTTFTI